MSYNNPAFELDNDPAYQQWRSAKLQNYPASVNEIIVDIDNPHALKPHEVDAMLACIQRCNMVIYNITTPQYRIEDKNIVSDIGRVFGLQHLDNNLYADEDAISSLAITSDAGQKAYIPYTNRPIAWHTDGYYNTGQQQIRGMLLHCVRPATDGGSNRLLDHEIAYLLLRDRNPAYIEALSRDDTMSIPANISEGEEIRAAVSGPVFSTDIDGQLHMRYTARTRSIEWLDDPLVLEAKDVLLEILKSDTPYHFEATLQAGQGLLCNNVLHTRSSFEAGSERLLYRGRYFDRIAGS
ncbi:MAG: TauD/TfdA family dioxygenase [Chromatiales bacterium]|jgi:hypothetical protein